MMLKANARFDNRVVLLGRKISIHTAKHLIGDVLNLDESGVAVKLGMSVHTLRRLSDGSRNLTSDKRDAIETLLREIFERGPT